MTEHVRQEEKEKADLISVVSRLTTSEKPAPSPRETSSNQLSVGVEEKGCSDLTEPEHVLSQDQSPKVQSDTSEQSGQGCEESASSAVLVVQLDSNETLENELEHEALLDTGADVILMSPGLFNKLQSMAH